MSDTIGVSCILNPNGSAATTRRSCLVSGQTWLGRKRTAYSTLRPTMTSDKVAEQKNHNKDNHSHNKNSNKNGNNNNNNN